MPGVIEWPARIPQPRVSDVNTVTTDIFATLCELAGQPVPQRPIDSISLVSLFDGKMTQRPGQIGFWNGGGRDYPNGIPYIDPELQRGTTPLVKLGPDGLATRTFLNYRHPAVREIDYNGARALLDNRFKLVVDGGPNSGRELFDVRADPAEKTNVIKAHPEVAAKMEQQLRVWQQSVLESLTGADYR